MEFLEEREKPAIDPLFDPFFFERGGCVCGTVCRTVTIFADLVSRLRMTGGAQGWPVNPVGGTALLACMLSLEGHFKPSVVTFMRR